MKNDTLDKINQTAFGEVVKRMTMFLRDLDKETMKANYTLGGKYQNNFRANDVAVNQLMNIPVYTDIHGDDVTDDCKAKGRTSYGIRDTDQLTNDLQNEIDDDKDEQDDDALKADKRALSFVQNADGEWTQDHGYSAKHDTDYYCTNVTYPAIRDWIKDIIKVIHGDLKADLTD